MSRLSRVLLSRLRANLGELCSVITQGLLRSMPDIGEFTLVIDDGSITRVFVNGLRIFFNRNSALLGVGSTGQPGLERQGY